MKALLVLIALFVSPAAFAAPDYYGMCKTELSAVASRASAYISSQSSECTSELNKPVSSRNNQVIGRACQNANQILLPIKQRAYAVCGQCRRLNNPQINMACTDNGLSSFIDAVNSL